MRKLAVLILAGLTGLVCFKSDAQTYEIGDAATVVTCSGTFYDSGGDNNVYSSNENLTETFTSAVSGQSIQISFFFFHTQNGNDLLTIYDGPSTSYPVIGQFSGVSSPGTVVSSASSLTFNFKSTSSSNKDGWEASISCVAGPTQYAMSNSTLSLCTGLFCDSGGSGSAYSNNENYTQTFTSSGSDCMQATFYSFNVQSGDTLKVYDGTSVSAATLIGSYSNSPTIPTRLLSSSGSLTFKFTSSSSGIASGWLASLACNICPSALAAIPNYIHPTSGLQGTHCGAVMVNTCGGTIADDGVFTSNYNDNLDPSGNVGYYQTFCPAVAGNCVRIQFYEIRISNGNNGSIDKLIVQNGPTQSSLPFGAPNSNNITNIQCTSYDQCMGLSKGPWTSYDQSGCLTVRFTSNNDGNTRAGWKATLDCVPCLNGPTGLTDADCIHATTICGDASFDDASVGPGLISEGENSCVVSENYTNWFAVTIENSGTLGLTITPKSTGGTGDDYDFALFGPNVACSSLGSALRCSYAGTAGVGTGMGNGDTDLSEGVSGNGWVQTLAVNAGEVYYLMVNKWSADGNGYDLTWDLTSGASLQCPLLPIALNAFTCSPQGETIVLDWTTQSEYNNDYYIIEKSGDGENFTLLTTMPGKGTIQMPSQYLIADDNPGAGNNFYRLSQVDKSGNKTELKTIACAYSDPAEEVIINVFDLSGRLIETTSIVAGNFEQYMYSTRLIPGVYVTAMVHPNGMTDLGKYLKL